MDNRYDKPKIAKINNDITHQNIGGKVIVIEREDTISYALDMPADKITIGLYNFIQRRLDLMNEEYENMKLYYGHVGTLGYYVAEDEISDLKETEWSEAVKYLQ